ncbi:MAG: class I SAM-dependent methyltransferase [Chloroflexia bacterium]
MSCTDPVYLSRAQYRDGSALGARMSLHERFSTNPYPWHRWAFDQLDLEPTARVLEVGCGPGELWRSNADRVPEGLRVVVTDLSPGMIREAEIALSDLGDGFTFQQVDACEIPFPEGAFDAAIANQMLYHVPDLPRALAEIARVLAPGGKLYAATNGRNHMAEMRSLREEIVQGRRPSSAPLKIGFTLESGAEQLSAHFGAVELRLREDSLHVTEAGPLMEYLLSAIDVRDALAALQPQEAEERVSSMAESLTQVVAERGGLSIVKSSGLFIAGDPLHS